MIKNSVAIADIKKQFDIHVGRKIKHFDGREITLNGADWTTLFEQLTSMKATEVGIFEEWCEEEMIWCWLKDLRYAQFAVFMTQVFCGESTKQKRKQDLLRETTNFKKIMVDCGIKLFTRRAAVRKIKIALQMQCKNDQTLDKKI